MARPLRATHIPQVYFAHEECVFNGLRINKNAIVFRDPSGDVYVCNHMPRYYKGVDPMLTIQYWDATFHYWETIKLRTYVTKIMYEAYCAGGMKRMTHEEDIEFSNNCVRKFKGHGMRQRPGGKNVGEIPLSSGECIIARTFNTGNMLSYNSNVM